MKHPVTKIRKRRKIEIVNYFGGKCSICGYDKNVNALCFHHTNPELKKHTPTKIINECKLEKAVDILNEEEVILVCLNCHAEIHSEDYDFNKLKERYTRLIKKECEQCGKIFYYPYHINKKERQYCSNECSASSKRKVERPDKENLIQILKNYSFEAVGRMFNVSGNTIRKWAIAYGLDPKTIKTLPDGKFGLSPKAGMNAGSHPV